MNDQSGSGNFADLNFSIDDSALQTLSEEPVFVSQFKQPRDVEVAQSRGGGKAEPPSRVKARKDIDGSSNDEYIKRRNRNNIAVKKSREKSKQKGEMTLENIERLKEENVKLEERVEVLSKELSVLKKVFMDHARGFSGAGSGADLPDLKLLETLPGHKLTDKSAGEADDQPSTSYTT